MNTSNAHNLLTRLNHEALRQYKNGSLNPIEWAHVSSCINEVQRYTKKYHLDQGLYIGSI